jgi:hypothetical protein
MMNMVIKEKFGLVAAAVAAITMSTSAVALQSDSALTVSATLVGGCAVSAASSITFTPFSTLATGNQTSNTAASFTVACSSDAVPKIFATGTRTLVGATAIPINLSLTAGAAANDLPATLALAQALTLVQDGTPKVVPLYAAILYANYAGRAAGTYTSAAITLSVSY